MTERRNNEVNQFMRRIHSAPRCEVSEIACREQNLPKEGPGIYAAFSRLGKTDWQSQSGLMKTISSGDWNLLPTSCFDSITTPKPAQLSGFSSGRFDAIQHRPATDGSVVTVLIIALVCFREETNFRTGCVVSLT